MGLEVGLVFQGVGVDDEGELAGQVVHHRQLVREHEQDVRGVDGIRLARAGQLLLDVAHRVVAEVAAQAAREAGHAGHRRSLEAGQVAFDER
jgi:hypothetical protein